MSKSIGCLLLGLALMALHGVPAGAEQDAAAVNDTYFADQWNLTAVNAPAAWAKSTGRGATIAIVDSGVDLTHPDLRKNVVSRGVDLVDPKGRDGAQDAHGHGTHVAGIAAAVTNNGLGVAGVAPHARILPVRVLQEDNSGTAEDVAEGIGAAAELGADVINVSISTAPVLGEAESIYYPVMEEAIAYAWDEGAVVVVAAGNTPGWPLCQQPSRTAQAICVGGVDPELNSLFWSRDTTTTSTHLVAPAGDPFRVGPRGECTRSITSTWLRGKSYGNSCTPGDDGYERATGTSMAAPVVAGVAALLASQGLDNKEIVDRLVSTARDLGPPGRDPVFGYGLVDAAAAVGASR